jgi:RimJ/RimL family protein N-acetyltransferase
VADPAETVLTETVLSWPAHAPAYGRVRLRAFRDADVAMVTELATDPYVPQIGSLTAHADAAAALGWIERQRGRLAEGAGYSFCVADRDDDRALGTIGLWTRDLAAGRATGGYSLAPSARGRGLAVDALRALTTFAWTLPLHRVELYVEPTNGASRRTAEQAGYALEGLLRSHQQIGGTRRDMCLYAAVREAQRTSTQVGLGDATVPVGSR